MKKYMDIPRLGHKTTLDYFTNIASKNHNIIVQIKYDGANGQFGVNETGELEVFSRNGKLDENINLRGFYQYVIEKVDPTRLPKNIKIFGEWLASHKIAYPMDMYNHFYLFNMFDSETQDYIHPNSEVYQNIRNYLIEELGMQEVLTLYEGPYKGIDHINEIFNKVTKAGETFTGQRPTTFNEVFNEGIVIKSHDYRDQYGNQLFVKMVAEGFKEVKEKKPRETSPDISVEKQIADFAATRARVEKNLHKLVDQGVLPEDFDMEQMGTIAKNLPRIVFEDIMKEELDTIKETFGEFDDKLIGKKINANVMNFVKDIIRERIETRVKNF